MKLYPKVTGLAAWKEKYKRNNSLPLDAVVSQSSEFSAITFYIASQRVVVVVVVVVDFVIYSVLKLLDTPS
jgi:hypothetical protein